MKKIYLEAKINLLDSPYIFMNIEAVFKVVEKMSVYYMFYFIGIYDQVNFIKILDNEGNKKID